MGRHLILLSALYKSESIEFIETQLISLFLSNSKNESTDILIITQEDYKANLDARLNGLGLAIKYFVVSAKTPMEASAAKLRIFEYPEIKNYSKVLYVDSAVIFHNPIDSIFDLASESSKLYAIEEGWVSHPWWGGDLFHQNTIKKDTSAFSMRVLLFQVSDEMKKLFKDIQAQIYSNKATNITDYLDQPFIIYQAITQKKSDTLLLKKYIEDTQALLYIPRLPMVYTKTAKIKEYMNRIYTRIINTSQALEEERHILKTAIRGKQYRLKEQSSNIVGSISFGDPKITVHLGLNSFWDIYTTLNASTCEVKYGNQIHILRFNSDRSFFVSIRRFDLALSYGSSS